MDEMFKELEGAEVTSARTRKKTITQQEERLEMLKLDTRQKTLLEKYKAEKKVPVRIAPSYAKYFGKIMRMSINGIAVAVPCNGQTIELPASFAAEAYARMAYQDGLENRRLKMSNYEANFERRPGDISFF